MPTESQELLGKIRESTKIIVSFGGREGGMELTMALRYEIMVRYGQIVLRETTRFDHEKKVDVPTKEMVVLDDAFCYLDAITLKIDRDNATSERIRLYFNKVDQLIDELQERNTKVKKNPRKRAIDTYVSLNDFWATYYELGVESARTMIFLISKKWLASAFCLQEFGWFIKHAIRKLMASPEINPGMIFMVFSDAEVEFKSLIALLKPQLTIKHGNLDAFSDEKYNQMSLVLEEFIVPINDDENNLLAASIKFFDLFDASKIVVPIGEDDKFQSTTYYNRNQKLTADDKNFWYSHTDNYTVMLTPQKLDELWNKLDILMAEIGIPVIVSNNHLDKV